MSKNRRHQMNSGLPGIPVPNDTQYSDDGPKGDPPYKTFTPTGDLVVLAPHHVKNETGLVLPETYSNPRRCVISTILAVGPKCESVKEGDLAVLGQGIPGQIIWHENMQYIIVPEGAISGVLVKDVKCNEKYVEISKKTVGTAP